MPRVWDTPAPMPVCQVQKCQPGCFTVTATPQPAKRASVYPCLNGLKPKPVPSLFSFQMWVSPEEERRRARSRRVCERGRSWPACLPMPPSPLSCTHGVVPKYTQAETLLEERRKFGKSNTVCCPFRFTCWNCLSFPVWFVSPCQGVHAGEVLQLFSCSRHAHAGMEVGGELNAGQVKGGAGKEEAAGHVRACE